MTARSPYDTLVTVYGGSGFLGRHVVRALAKRHYRIRVAVRRPELANFLQPLGRVGQIHAVPANLRNAPSVEAAARDAQVLDQSGRHSVRTGSPAVRGGSCLRGRTGGAGGQCAWRAYGPCVRDRRRRERDQRLRPLEGDRGAAGLGRTALDRDHAALDPVRPRRRFLQPLCRARAHVAGTAVDRRRAHAFPAGLRRRRCHRDRRRRRRQGAPRHDLRTGRPGHPHVQGSHAIRTRDDRAQTASCAACRSPSRSCRRCFYNICRNLCSRPIRSNCFAPTTWCRKPQNPKCERFRALASNRSRSKRSSRLIFGGSARPASSASVSPHSLYKTYSASSPPAPTRIRHHANSAKL